MRLLNQNTTAVTAGTVVPPSLAGPIPPPRTPPRASAAGDDEAGDLLARLREEERW